jgi:hypothetical protein
MRGKYDNHGNGDGTRVDWVYKGDDAEASWRNRVYRENKVISNPEICRFSYGILNHHLSE